MKFSADGSNGFVHEVATASELVGAAQRIWGECTCGWRSETFEASDSQAAGSMTTAQFFHAQAVDKGKFLTDPKDVEALVQARAQEAVKLAGVRP